MKLLKYDQVKLLMRLLLITILLCSLGFGQIFHGASIQMTNTGTGVYYKPGLPISNNSQVICDIGFHFDNTIQTTNYYGVIKQNRAIFMEIAAGYRQELLKEMIAGVFRPVIIMQGWGSVDMDTISCDNITGQWTLKYGSGAGFQFYNGRILNEIMLKLNQYFSTDRSIAFQLSIYWK